jgi:23S rRNA pseudouridine1911/1915/1917 synthase
MREDPAQSVNEPQILHDDGEWFVLDKPAGWHSAEQSGTADAPSVSQWLVGREAALANLPEAGLVHRLDRTTSGCLLVARDVGTQADLREALQVAEGRWASRKSYLALVGPGVEEAGSFDLHFAGRHKSSARVTAKPFGKAAERGRCEWRLRRRARRGEDRCDPLAFDLISVDLIGPGRRHQIRAGFAYLGHALAGDALYGGLPVTGDLPEDWARLHAHRLRVRSVDVEAPAPKWAATP